MNSDQVEGIIRSILIGLSSVAAAWGIDNATWLTIVGGFVALAGVLWSVYSNSTTRLVTSVAADPGVSKVVVKSPSLAMSVISPKVVVQP